MIPLKDKDGNTLILLDEKRFPLSLPLETIYGDREYKIYLTYQKDENKQPTEKIKAMNMG